MFGLLTGAAKVATRAARGLGDLLGSDDELGDPLQADTLGDPLCRAPAAEPSVATAAAPVQRGDQGPAVQAIQDQLVAGGFLSATDLATGPGTFGPKTQAAVERAQAAAGLPVTGVVDDATRAALAQVSAAAPPVEVADAPSDAPSDAPASIGSTHGDIAAAALAWGHNVPSDASRIGSPWLTDMSDGDGARVRAAIQRYADWKEAGAVDADLPAVRDAMKAELTTGAYSAGDAKLLVARIEETFAGTVPSTDDDTMILLGIRSQCVEWANHVALDAGGSGASHKSGTAVPRDEVEPGMGLTTGAHYMLITAVNTADDGAITSVDVADSNWGKGWSNPGGEIPWERKVRQRAGVSLTGTVKRHD